MSNNIIQYLEITENQKRKKILGVNANTARSPDGTT